MLSLENNNWFLQVVEYIFELNLRFYNFVDLFGRVGVERLIIYDKKKHE